MALNIIINSPDSDDKINSFVNPRSGLAKQNLNGIENYALALEGGAYNFTDGLIVIAGKASATVTFTGAPTAAQTVTINGVVFTARASGATGNEFNIGGNVTATALNLATAINASTTDGISGAVTASSSSGVVTITAITPGKAGLGYTIAETLSNATATNFALASAETSRTSF